MSRKLDIVDPVADATWNETLLASPASSFFHTSNWAAVLQRSYGYRPLYFARTEAGKLEALVPLMEVKSPLTGKRAVSLPFTDYCEPILNGRAAAQELDDAIKDYARTAHWRYVELRGGEALGAKPIPSATFYRHVLDISKSENELFAALRDSTKRNFKKAAKQGLTVERSRTPGALREFYRLHCLTRKGHGLPPQPFHFFERIHDHVIAAGLGDVITAVHDGRIVAAAVYFHFGRDVIYKYGASDKAYQWLRPNNLVMWEAIKWYAQNGFRSLCLGRTELQHAGLRQFKVGWGAEERLIRYFKYDLRRDAYIPETPSTAPGPHHRLMTLMPVPLLRLAGSLLYKHMG